MLPAAPPAAAPVPAALSHAVTSFKHAMASLDRDVLLRRRGEEELQREVAGACDGVAAALGACTGGGSPADDAAGAYVFQETFSLFFQSELADRAFAKPRGYAGDYFTIEMLYADAEAGTGRLGRYIDRWVRDIPAARAVRNRRGLLAGEIRAAAAMLPAGEPLLVTSLASGPARELLDVLTAPDAPPLLATAIDIDDEAVAFATASARRLGVADRLNVAQDNVLRLARGRGRVALAPQHLIYSVGLIDYLADDHVVRLMDWAHGTLQPGGTLIVGNFDVTNPHRAFMDHIMEWRLIHRTPAELRALFARSRFGAAPVRVRAERAGVNLFASCARDESPAH